MKTYFALFILLFLPTLSFGAKDCPTLKNNLDPIIDNLSTVTTEITNENFHTFVDAGENVWTENVTGATYTITEKNGNIFIVKVGLKGGKVSAYTGNQEILSQLKNIQIIYNDNCKIIDPAATSIVKVVY
jgi:hypothetical protein